MDPVVLIALIVLMGMGCVVASTIAVVRLVVARNRVVAGRPTQAPLRWLTSHRAEARLHRRLRAAMTTAAAAESWRAGEGLGLAEVLADLQQRAVDLDLQLVLASKAPRAMRRRMLHELRTEVREVERLVERIVRLGRTHPGSAPSDRSLSAVRERLELLEGALRELDGVDIETAFRRYPELEQHARRQA